ncbi:hypothetical protein [Ralstonia sp. 24A2]|uniref:hypothetical protein n=1 Tax=Ralstonia sp. 24A2 TaxID=3447364 RepID=UPI003F6A0884
MPDGTVISGGAAREARLKAAGGVQRLLKKVANEAVANAVNNAFMLGMRAASAAPANDNVVPMRRARGGRRAQ